MTLPTSMIMIYEPNIKNYTKSAIDAITSGWISNHGIYIEKATNLLKNTVGAKHVILMANGTVATHCLFISLKYKHPQIKKIYIPNNCYVAAWNSVLAEYPMEDLEVMKMDIDTWNINTSIEYVNSLEVNSAVLIVHNLGNIVNVPRLKKLRPDLIFIEDNCEGVFGKYDGIFSGTSETTLCSSVSFYGNKIITTGEGGAFVTNDTEIYEYIKKVYSQGMSSQRYIHDTFAYNYRMTNIEAGFLFDQLSDLDNILANKKRIFDGYENLLQDLINEGKIKLFKSENNTEFSRWIFALRLVGNVKSMAELTDYFKANNVDIRPFFYPIECHGHLKDIKYEYDEIAHLLNREIIMIPSSPGMSIDEQKYVISIIDKLVHNN